MKRIAPLSLALVLLMGPALAAEPEKPAAPAPLPITLTADEYVAVVNYLNQQPAGIANPVLSLLVGKEQAAQAALAKKP